MTAPAATGQRRAWGELPERVRAATETWLGSPVASATTQPTGFSPRVAARLACADGRRYFVKAVSAEPNPTSPAYHRREARIVGALPATAPVPGGAGRGRARVARGTPASRVIPRRG